MDYKDLTAILIKTTGAVLFFWYLTWLPSLLPLASDQFGFQMFFVNAFPAIAGLIFAIFLFTFPTTITNKLVSGDKVNFNDRAPYQIQIIAVRLIGIYHILVAVTDLVHHVSKAALTPMLYQEMGISNPASGWTPDVVAWVIASVIELFIAIWFVLGAKGIVGFVEKMRGRHVDSHH